MSRASISDLMVACAPGAQTTVRGSVNLTWVAFAGSLIGVTSRVLSEATVKAHVSRLLTKLAHDLEVRRERRQFSGRPGLTV